MLFFVESIFVENEYLFDFIPTLIQVKLGFICVCAALGHVSLVFHNYAQADEHIFSNLVAIAV